MQNWRNMMHLLGLDLSEELTVTPHPPGKADDGEQGDRISDENHGL